MIRKLFIAVLLVVLVSGFVLPVLAAVSPPDARNDALEGTTGAVTDYPVATLFQDNGTGADDLGSPPATIKSFGGGSMGGSVTDNTAGSEADFAGGKLKVNANGSMVISNPTQSGLFIFIYRLSNSAGSDDASVTVQIKDAPQARNDAYAFLYGADKVVTAANGLFADNGHGVDYLGVPMAALTSFGDRSLGGSVTDNPAGSSVPLADGTLTVNADGSWSMSGAPFTPGDYQFRYRLENSVGRSNGLVSFSIQAKPIANDDALGADLDQANNYAAGALFADNGSSADELGYPEAPISSFGGGSLGGLVTDNAAGATVAFAGGTLTVEANGAMAINTPTTAGTYTFSYRLSNAAGTSDATVTVVVARNPVANDDAYTFINTADQNHNAAAGLFADNGSGVDKLGDPAAEVIRFGGGSLGGNVTSYVAGDSAPLAGGTLTVNSDGSWSLSGNPFEHGSYTFDYRLQNSGGTSDATVTFTIQAKPIAQDDSFLIDIGDPYNGDLFSNNGSGPDDLGTPTATLTSFGGPLSSDVTDNAAGSTIPFAGGSLTVDSDGKFALTSAATPGVYSFYYRISNGLGTSDAWVSILVSALPEAKDDVYSFDYAADYGVGDAGGLFADNGSGADDLGKPTAVLTSFGGKSLGGSVSDHDAGTTAFMAGGVLRVSSNGSWSLTGAPFIPGEYRFDYRIANAGGISDATVTLNVQADPMAADDDLWVQLYVKTESDPGKLFEDNGHGDDENGYPVAPLVSFGGGDLGGAVGDNAAGTEVAFAGGRLTVNADGSITVDAPKEEGTFTFEYRLESTLGSSDALVTIKISEEPETFYSLYPVIFR